MLKTARSSGGGGGSGTVTQINTAGPITGGPITTTGTINLAVSGVTANTYGGVTAVPVIAIDVYGRVTSASNVTISTGGVTNVATGAGLTGGPITTTGTISLATSGVTANTYGSATVIPIITVDTYGRITTASNVTIASTGVTNVATSGNISGGPITSTGTLSLTSNVVTINETQTVTLKRITPRNVAITSSATITPTGDASDQYEVTALAVTATIAAPSGTPTDGQKLILRIKDNGTPQTLSWTTTSGGYRAVAVVLPTTTVASSVFYAGCIYNSQDTYWDVVTTVQQ